jgi:hypothetical protein
MLTIRIISLGAYNMLGELKYEMDQVKFIDSTVY